MKPTTHALMIAVLLSLLVLTVVSNQPVHHNAAAQTTHADDGVVEVDVSVRGTFLHADPYGIEDDGIPDPQDGGPPEPPSIVELQAGGMSPGDKILISFRGSVDVYGGSNYKEVSNLYGVFSTSADLKPINQVHRVPGAIGAGTEAWTGPTYFGGGATDIPEDFKIAPSTGFWIEVPRNARYLFICLWDSWYSDNKGPGPIKVTIEKDTDGDGLLDSWEMNGMDLDKDGTVDLDLPMLQADWQRKDIFVEVDYMSGRAPRGDAMSDVKNAFAANGINLHVIVGEAIPFATVLNGWAEYDALKASYFGTADERSNPNAMEAKKLVFRYCLFVHQIWFDPPDYDVPGVAEVLGNDFIVAAGAFANAGTRQYQAAVFMHELGHTLGLKHGGKDDVNYKPNYLSVMNYSFQFPIWKPNRPLDYSHGLFIELDEANLNENEGIGLSEVTVWRAPDGLMHRSDGDLAIDWNCDNVTGEGVQVNLNDNPNEPSPAGQSLKDYNDWANLVYRFRDTRHWAASATLDEHHAELTGRQIQEMEEEAKNMPALPSSGSGILTAIIYAAIGVGVAGILVAAVWLLKRKRSAP